MGGRKIFQGTRPVARFSFLGGQKIFLRGKDFCFYYMFKTNFSGHNKIWGEMFPGGYGHGSHYNKV